MCGACCKRAATHPAFPLATNPDGSCMHLVDNKCSIYDTRPLVCRIKEYGQSIGKQGDEWIKANIRACNEIMDQDGVPQEYRIEI